MITNNGYSFPIPEKKSTKKSNMSKTIQNIESNLCLKI